MNVAENLLGRRRPGGVPAQRAIVRIDEDDGPVGHLHRLGEILLAEYLDDGNSRGSELPLNSIDQLLLRQRFGTYIDIPEAGMQPVIDVSFERHDAPGQPQYEQEDRGNQSEPKVDLKKDDTGARYLPPALLITHICS